MTILPYMPKTTMRTEQTTSRKTQTRRSLMTCSSNAQCAKNVIRPNVVAMVRMTGSREGAAAGVPMAERTMAGKTKSSRCGRNPTAPESRTKYN